MSARKLASRTDIHPSFVSLILAGKRAAVSPDIATRIASTLGVRPGILFQPVSTTIKRETDKRKSAK